MKHLKTYRYHLLLVIWCFAISATIANRGGSLNQSASIPAIRLCEVIDGRVDIRDCGARLDGSDDTAALQAAMNAVGIRGGGVFIPGGRTVKISNTIPPPNVYPSSYLGKVWIDPVEVRHR